MAFAAITTKFPLKEKLIRVNDAQLRKEILLFSSKNVEKPLKRYV